MTRLPEFSSGSIPNGANRLASRPRALAKRNRAGEIGNNAHTSTADARLTSRFVAGHQ